MTNSGTSKYTVYLQLYTWGAGHSTPPCWRYT